MGMVTILLEEGKRVKGEEGNSDSAREGGNKERRAGWARGSRQKGRRVGGWERERLTWGRGDGPRGKGDRPDPIPARYTLKGTEKRLRSFAQPLQGPEWTARAARARGAPRRHAARGRRPKSRDFRLGLRSASVGRACARPDSCLVSPSRSPDPALQLREFMHHCGQAAELAGVPIHPTDA